MKRLKAFVFGATLLVASLMVLPATNMVSAQDLPTSSGGTITICSFIQQICDAFPNGLTGQSAYDFIAARFNTILSIVFLGIILLGVYVVVSAGVKFIRSQGKPEEIAGAQKAIQSVFLGIGAMFVGIVGIVLVLAFFGGTGLLNSGANIDFDGDGDINFNNGAGNGGGTGGNTEPECPAGTIYDPALGKCSNAG